jgi:signal transduction histidine kinase
VTGGVGVDGTVAFLRGLPLLAGLPEEDLTRVAGLTRRVVVPPGHVVMEEGTEGDGLYILVDGELEVTRREGGGEIVLSVLGPGAFLGEMSLLERAPRNATARAVRRSELLVVAPEEFHDLLAGSPAAAITLLRTFATRLRSTESALRQNAQLASLGTLAAGLAHELNNPAAALSRSAASLPAALAALERSARRLGELGIDPPHEAVGGDARPVTDLPALNRAEDEVADWLEDHGVDEAVDMASSLALYGWSPDRLDALVAPLSTGQVAPVLDWLAAHLAATALVDESRQAAEAISAIVGAVRAHTYLGRAAVQNVDVREGLESALVLLRGRLSPGITVLRHYAPDLPIIEAYGGELNQVWMNLLDNAIRAIEEGGTIELRTRRDRDGVMVEVADTGAGIPAEVRPRIFDPFFTTRPFGSGSGLGLHVSHTIVRRHGGRIDVESEPGRTVFSVWLPLRLPPRDP